MPNRPGDYKDMKKFAETRRAQRKRYYAKTAWKYEKRRWTKEEDELVVKKCGMTDTQISDEICRSVKAIQMRRQKLKKKENN